MQLTRKTYPYEQAHTGCPSYTVHPRQLQPLHDQHQQYLTLETEKRALEAVFTQLERHARWTTREQATFTATLQRYKAVLAEQAELRTTILTRTSLAVAVND